MKKYAKIVNEETKECQVGTGTNVKFYQSIGMVEMDVEQAYNGQWYVAGYAPEKPEPTIEEKNEAIRQTRASLYAELIDPLHAQKTKDTIMDEWSEEREQEYIAEVKRLTIKIREENPYIETVD
jgi:hypothetical protein